MFERQAPVRNRVTFTIDGREVEAERGEPLAVALLAAGEGTIARSPKLHRPRGPACLRGDCDGCLARVDGVPNVMTCMRDVRGGDVVEGQNVLGSRKTDLLRLTDWFFPKGIDHHHLMAGIPAAQSVMQTIARRMAGIGRLPDRPAEPEPAKRLACDVLVVGAGPAGLACAAELAKAGLEVVVVDDGAAPGGSGVFAGDAAAAAQITALAESLPEGALHLRTSCAGFYDRDALLVGASGATVTSPRATVIATGAHDGVLVTEGNDMPGVMGARAVCALASRGIVPRDGAVIIGDGAWADRAAKALGDRCKRRVREADVERVLGSAQVEGLRLKGGEEIACGVVAVATPCAPSFELAEQRGAETRHGSAGYAVVVDEAGRAAEGLWATGECTGAAPDVDAILAHARRVAADVLASLRG